MIAASASRPAPVALEVSGLCVDYRVGRSRQVRRVVHDVGFALSPGRTLALVGESGSGKSTIAKAITGLADVASGRILLDGTDVVAQRARDRRAVARSLQMVFQNPYGSFDPYMTVGDALMEPLRVAGGMTRSAARQRVAELLERVHLPSGSGSRYPGEFSGGQRQRLAIARALALRPAVVVCDEPTSALDVTTQMAVIELLAELQRDTGVSLLFITHDLALVRSFADEIAVLNDGRIVEQGLSARVCDAPIDPYTRALVDAVPVPDPRLQRRRRARREAAHL